VSEIPGQHLTAEAPAANSELPSIAIVTPSFNHAVYVGATVRSVLEQDYPKLDYWVIDGNSTDATLEVLHRYGRALQWITEPDRGQADAINKGFRMAKGDVLGWVNSDDRLSPGALRHIGEIFAAEPHTGVVYGDAEFIDADGNFIAPCAHIEPFDRQRLMGVSDFLVQPAVFFRRSLFDAVRGLDASLHWAMDYDLWLKLSGVAKFRYTPRVLAQYRWLESSKTAAAGWNRLREVESVSRRYGGRGLPAYFRLEAARLHLIEIGKSLKRVRLHHAIEHALRGAGVVLGSSSAVRSLFSARTWKIIRTGRQLRRRSRELRESS